MELRIDQSIGELATAHPAAVRVFQRRRINFCCGGGQALDQVCSHRGLDPNEVLAEIRSEMERNEHKDLDWSARPLPELIGHLLERYHQPLYAELPRLERMAAKVRSVHGPRDPVRFAAIVHLIAALEEELNGHMMREERVLFPAIAQGFGPRVGMPIQIMRRDHDTMRHQLEQLRELTGNYAAPEEACTTWRALWAALAKLDDELMAHVHLENNVLFPRALRG
jgi:regulator of cell morphogenesis and NO signaling